MEGVEDLLTEEEAAGRIGYSRQWLRSLRLSGKGPVFIRLGNRIMYDPTDVTAWIRQQRQDPAKSTEV